MAKLPKVNSSTHMPPHKLRDELLLTLRALQRGMSELEFLLKLEKQDNSVKKEAAKISLNVSMAIVRIVNEDLSDIRDSLRANESTLKNATKKMRAELDELEKVKKVLRAASKLVEVTARIVSLIL